MLPEVQERVPLREKRSFIETCSNEAKRKKKRRKSRAIRARERISGSFVLGEKLMKIHPLGREGTGRGNCRGC
jgi:hypothetical protein